MTRSNRSLPDAAHDPAIAAHHRQRQSSAAEDPEPGAPGHDLTRVGAARSKTITWHDPAVLAAAAGTTLSGRQFLEAVLDGRIPPAPILELTGARLVSVDDGEAVFHCTPDESTYNPLGLVHGGLLCTLLDSAAGCAVHTKLPPGAGYSSIEIKVSFLKPLRAGAGRIEARGHALRVGRRVAFAETHARNTEGELVGHATSSLAITRPST